MTFQTASFRARGWPKLSHIHLPSPARLTVKWKLPHPSPFSPFLWSENPAARTTGDGPLAEGGRKKKKKERKGVNTRAINPHKIESELRGLKGTSREFSESCVLHFRSALVRETLLSPRLFLSGDAGPGSFLGTLIQFIGRNSTRQGALGKNKGS